MQSDKEKNVSSENKIDAKSINNDNNSSTGSRSKLYNINTYVDKIYYINMDKSVQRNTNMISWFEQIGIVNYKRVAGVIYKDNIPTNCQIKPYHQQLDENSYIRGALGCLASHRTAIKDALEKNYERICIFEDDVDFVDDFNTKFDKFAHSLEENYKGYELAYLSLNYPNNLLKDSPVHQVRDNAFGTQAYILNNHNWVFNHVLKSIDNMGIEIDMVYNHLIVFKYLANVYLSNPSLCNLNACSFVSNIAVEKAERKIPTFYNENNEIINHLLLESEEQRLANKYVKSDDIVLELGARYGTVSYAINSKLENKKNHVCVEPDERVWKALDDNKTRNNCDYNIVKGFVSRKKLDLVNKDVCFNGYGATAVENNNTSIESFTLEEIINKYGLDSHFTTLVADCEGFLEQFLDENPNLYNDLKTVIFEADYPEKCNYEKIRNNLKNRGFYPVVNGFQNVYMKYYTFNIDNYVDRIFYINEDGDIEKNDYMISQFRKHCITNYQRISVNAERDIDEAHKYIIERAISKNYKRICILQNDITFSKDFKDKFDAFIKDLEESQNKYQLAFLGTSQSLQTVTEKYAYQIFNNSCGESFAYILNDHNWVFRHVLLNIDYMKKNIGLVYDCLVKSNHLSFTYACSPAIITEN